jgi:hypothetical protein
MDSEGRLQFSKLSSVNYRQWSFTIKAVLASKDLIQYINTKVDDLVDDKARELSESTASPEPAQDGDDAGALLATPANTTTTVGVAAAVAKATKELQLGDAKAKALIIIYLGVDQLSFVATATTAYEQWQLLKSIYEPTGPAQLAALLAAFHGYALRPGVQVDKVASDLTTIQADIRLIELAEAPTDNAKLVTLTELLLRSNNRYESTILMIRSIDNIGYGQAVLMLKQAEERIQATSGAGRTTEIAMSTRERALFALDKPKFKPSGRGRDAGLRGGFGRRAGAGAGDSRAKGRPTGGNRECWHCGSQTHIRTACPSWLNTPEGTKWAAKNPSKNHPRWGIPSGQVQGAWTVWNTPSLGVNPTTWLVDSGATSHMTWNRALFTTFEVIEPPTTVTVANGTTIPCQGVGTVELHQDGTMLSCITIQNVRYMPDLNINLLSVSGLEDKGICITSRPGFLDLIRDGRTLATARRNGGTYVLELGGKNHPNEVPNGVPNGVPNRMPNEVAFTAKADVITWDRLHARLAHIGDQFISNIPGTVKAFIMPPKPTKKKACDPCQMSKQVRIISRTPPVPATLLLGRLYIDGWGPYSVLALGFKDA